MILKNYGIGNQLNKNQMENALLKNCLPLNELKQFILLNQHHVKIVDVRSKEEYEQYHIPGAINIELSNLSIANELFDNQDILVTTCGKGGGRSTQASETLKELGFKNVYWLCGGTLGWV
jgi:rhodanese-related sulfurtransferase